MWNKPAEGNVSPQASSSAAQVPSGSKTSSPAPTPTSYSAPAPTTAAPSSSSTISAGLHIHGEFSGNSDLYIDGEAQGSIRLGQSKVTVGPHGRVQADIDAREILIEGTVHGNLKASECIHLGAGSRVQGSMLTPRVAIDDGARLRGKVEMTKPGDSRRMAGQAKGSEVASVAAAPAAKV
jgi:cytoskeletal protein CcmA (bactofilin family)